MKQVKPEISNKINLWQIINYSLLAFPLSFLTIPIYLYLPNYYANNFAISLSNIGLILLISRLLDAISDPILGFLSDKYSLLKRKIIIIALPFLAIAFIFLFYPLILDNIAIWLFVNLFITYLLFSLVQINYQSLAVEFSSNDSLKTKIVAFRETFGVLGIVFASIMPSLLFLYFSEINSFLIIGFGYFVLIIFSGLCFYFKSPEIKQQTNLNLLPNLTKQNDAKTYSWRKNLTFLKNSQLKHILAIFFFNSCTFGITASLMIFFVKTVLNLASLNSLFLSLYFIGLLFGIGFWAKIATILSNKIKAWSLSMILIIVIFAFCVFLKQGNAVEYGLICLLSGFCFGADYCLSYSILADIIQKENLQKSSSSVFGSINFIIKICFAVISGLLIFFLGKIQENLPNFEKNFLLISYCLLPCIFKIISWFFLQKLSSSQANNISKQPILNNSKNLIYDQN